MRRFYLTTNVNRWDSAGRVKKRQKPLHLDKLFLTLKYLKVFVWDVYFDEGAMSQRYLPCFIAGPLYKSLSKAIPVHDAKYNTLFSIKIRLWTHDVLKSWDLSFETWRNLLYLLPTGSREITFFPLSTLNVPNSKRRHGLDLHSEQPSCEVTLLFPLNVQHFYRPVALQGPNSRLHITIGDPRHPGLACIFACADTLEKVYIKPVEGTPREFLSHRFSRSIFPRLRELHFKLLSATICDIMLDLVHAPYLQHLSLKLKRAPLPRHIDADSLMDLLSRSPTLRKLTIMASYATGSWQLAVASLEELRLRLEPLKIALKIDFQGAYHEKSLTGPHFNATMPLGLLPCFCRLKFNAWAFLQLRSIDDHNETQRIYPNVTHMQLVTHVPDMENTSERGLNLVLTSFQLPALQRLDLIMWPEVQQFRTLSIVEKHLFRFPALCEIILYSDTKLPIPCPCPTSFKLACAQLGIKAGAHSAFTHARLN